MFNVQIKRRNDAEKTDGTAALYAVVCIDRKKIRIPVGLSVTDQEWDAVKQRVRGRSEEASDKNLIISNLVAKITLAMVKIKLSGHPTTMEIFNQY
ncbi:MAG: hypothetical protein HDS93_01810 [Bacteroidales bacterium]|nr:hypothetical protein [Bacteroidales bacterium]